MAPKRYRGDGKPPSSDRRKGEDAEFSSKIDLGPDVSDDEPLPGELSDSDASEFPEIDDESAEEASGTDLEDSDAGEESGDDYDEEDSDVSEGTQDSQADSEEEASDASSSQASETSLDSLTLSLRRETQKPDEREPENPFIGLGKDASDYMKKGHYVISELTGEPVQKWEKEIEPVYDSDSSTEETENRVGNVPSYFYDDMPHIGYDIDGKKIMRPATKDELDKFLHSVESEDGGWTTVRDKLNQKDVKLSEEELKLVKRLVASQAPEENLDVYAPAIDFFTKDVMDMPLNGAPEPKSRFVPSKWEHQKVIKIVRGIRQGRIVPSAEKQDKKDDFFSKFYGVWSDADQERAPHPMHMPAPKLPLPSHEESYNPPQEYLWSKEEKEAYDKLDDEDKKNKFVPQKIDSLRRVPAYDNFVQERFERCLDLYLAPRMHRRKPRLDISDPSELIPEMPSPDELRPFPKSPAVKFVSPVTSRIRSLSLDPTGTWLATGHDNGVVRIWLASVGVVLRQYRISSNTNKALDDALHPVTSVAWSPNKDFALLAAGCEGRVCLLSPLGLLSSSLRQATVEHAFYYFEASKEEPDPDRPMEQHVRWAKPRLNVREQLGELDAPELRTYDVHDENTDAPLHPSQDEEWLLTIDIPGNVKQVTWHHRGDYFASVASNAGSRNVIIHQISRHHSQAPFQRLKGDVQCVAFHPTKGHLFVANQLNVREYDLVGQKLVRKLSPGVKWISSLDVHPLGDNVIVGSYDKRLVWHDLDLSTAPYKTLRYHNKAIRSVAFSPRFPLFATASDDGLIHIFHATVYSDLINNARIVPLKILRAHKIQSNGLGVLSIQWHPTEPWLLSAGADDLVWLWTP